MWEQHIDSEQTHDRSSTSRSQMSDEGLEEWVATPRGGSVHGEPGGAEAQDGLSGTRLAFRATADSRSLRNYIWRDYPNVLGGIGVESVRLAR